MGLNFTPPTTSATPTGSTGLNFTPPTGNGTSAPQPSLGQSIWNTIGKPMLDTAQSGADQLTSTMSDIKSGQGNPFMNGLNLLNGLATGASAVLAPAFKVFSDTMNDPTKQNLPIQKAYNDITNNPDFQKFAMTPQGQMTSKILDVVAKGANVAGTALGLGAGVDESLNPTVKTPIKTQPLSQSIQDTMPLETKNVKIDALRNTLPDSGIGNGGVTVEGALKTPTIQPNEADIARGTTAHEYIANATNPVEKIANLNQGIINTSNQTNAFLDENSSHANFEDMRNYVEANNQPPTNITKDPTAFDSYNRATENALNTLYDTMKETATKTGNFSGDTPASDIRNARIAVDAQITKELGDTPFDSPQWKGIKAAELSARNTLNNMEQDIVRYPDQLEQLNKYNEFKSQLVQKGIKIDPAYDTQLKAKFNLQSTPESEVAAQKVADLHQKMSTLYDARDNLIDKNQATVGKNILQKWKMENPEKARFLTRAGYTLVGIGAAGAIFRKEVGGAINTIIATVKGQ